MYDCELGNNVFNCSGRKWTIYEEEKLLYKLNYYLSSNTSENLPSDVRLLRRLLHVRKVSQKMC